MAGNKSNADLRAEALDLAKQLGEPEPELDGKKNSELVTIVAQLRAKLPVESASEPPAESAEPEAPNPAAPTPAPVPAPALGLGARRKEPEPSAGAVVTTAPATPDEPPAEHPSAAPPLPGRFSMDAVMRAVERLQRSEPSPEASYRIAKGRSCTSRRGILGPGAVVKVSDFHGGEQSLAAMIRLGVVVRA